MLDLARATAGDKLTALLHIWWRLAPLTHMLAIATGHLMQAWAREVCISVSFIGCSCTTIGTFSNQQIGL